MTAVQSYEQSMGHVMHFATERLGPGPKRCLQSVLQPVW
jgi:hypothetical protein